MSESRSRPRVWLAVAAAALAVAVVGARLARSGPSPATPAAAVPVEFAAGDILVVEARALTRSLPLTGTLWPHSETLVKARAAGELQSLAVREGERVRRAQVLGRIDPLEAEARLAQQRADLEAARAQLALAKKNWAQQQTLLEREFISKNAFDNTQSNHDVASARVRAAEAAVEVAAKAVRDTVLIAPIDGVVAQRFAKPGERVAVDGRVLSIMDLTRLEITAPVPAADISRVRIGQAASFRVEGYPEQQFAGTVERINPAAVAGSRSIDIYVVVDNPGGVLRGGLFANGHLVLEQLPERPVLPRSALRVEGGRSYVYVVADGRIQRREVTTAAELPDQGLVQIAAGLAAGTRVVRHNLGPLADGAPARVLP